MDREQLRKELSGFIDKALEGASSFVGKRFFTPEHIKVLRALKMTTTQDDGTVLDRVLMDYKSLP